MRVVGLDVSRTVAEIAYLEDWQVKPGGRVELVQAVLTRWAATQLRATDHVVLEATGNTTAVINAVRAHVARVVVANPFQVRLIAEARVKTTRSTQPSSRSGMRVGFSLRSGFRMMPRRRCAGRSRAGRRSSVSVCASRTKCIRCSTRI